MEGISIRTDAITVHKKFSDVKSAMKMIIISVTKFTALSMLVIRYDFSTTFNICFFATVKKYGSTN